MWRLLCFWQMYGILLLSAESRKTKGKQMALDAKTANTVRHLLMRLSAETTVDAWLLAENEELAEMWKDGATYEQMLEWVNENY
jgi:hypothetical protein